MHMGAGELLSVLWKTPVDQVGILSCAAANLWCVRGNHQEPELGFSPLSSSPVCSLGDGGGRIKSSWQLNFSAQKLQTL